MTAVTLIFPHQLYKDHPSLSQGREVYLIEDALFFLQYPFHKQKLLLHRATMKYYEDYLRRQGYQVRYIECHSTAADMGALFAQIAASGVDVCHYADTTDYLLERRLHRYAARHEVRLVMSESPNFIHSRADNKAYFAEHKYYLTDYYVHLRRKYDIMLDKGKPMGGKWTYDTENRKKLPKGITIPSLPPLKENSFIAEARRYVHQHFGSNPGSIDRTWYPITHEDAERWLDSFLRERFAGFGIYQDAIAGAERWLYHSILTPMLNVGLLQPSDVVERAVAFAAAHGIPVNSLEGFVRQVLGWREYIRAVYTERGVYQRNRDFWGHTGPMPQALYQGTTGLAPVDMAIERLLDTGYTHHIERLMVLGNFMLLCGIRTDEVYRWFMELYIDSYDWVMVPNVYGMSQYADGGLMSTKPYISGSNYLLKMSNYPKGPWCEIWDALYWRFIHEHRAVFAANPRMSMMAALVSGMERSKLQHHITVAERFLGRLK
ncbi:MAG: cryptochrome/photolyase family protein [Bacteroidetes bacterium]|nr:cryptochrome/photolyase family protein [Bacteroidota bacterium]